MTPEERARSLVDNESFDRVAGPDNLDTPSLEGSTSRGFAGGWGTIDGRRVFVAVADHVRLEPPQIGWATRQTSHVMDLALEAGAPFISLIGSAESPIRQDIPTLAALGELLDRRVRSSGVIPQLLAVTGHVSGFPCVEAGLCDLVVAIDGVSQMHLHDPGTIERITGERTTTEALGGSFALDTRSGLANFVAADEAQALGLLRYLLAFLPSNHLQTPPNFPTTDAPDRITHGLEELLPVSQHVPYDVTEVIRDIVDDGEMIEVTRGWAKNMITAFARLDGHAVGIVASQPSALAGTLDIASSLKGARFVRLCDAFNIPLLAMLDVPGFRPGIQEEFGGIIRHGAKLAYAFSEATVPRITLILRKAYGGAYIVMNSRHMRADLSWAWPTAEIAVMGAEGAARIIHRKELADSSDPASRQAVLAEEYRTAFSNPYQAAERGYVDAVVPPAETRFRLIQAFEMLRGKRETLPPRKHGNIPL